MRDVALGEDRPVDEHGHPAGEIEDEIHVVLDQQHRHLGRQGIDDVEDLLSLAFGHAGHRLVEQQHARPAGKRHRDLEQAALAIGQLGDALALHVFETELMQERIAGRADAAGRRRAAATSRRRCRAASRP